MSIRGILSLWGQIWITKPTLYKDIINKEHMTKTRTTPGRRNRTPVGETTTTPVVPQVQLFPEGFLSEREAMDYLGVSRSTLAMWRVKWNKIGHGTGTGTDGCGPLFYEGPGGRIAYQREDLDKFMAGRAALTADPKLWKPARASKGKK
jgi:hypothetical protein